MTGSTARAALSAFPSLATTSRLNAAVDIRPTEQWMIQEEERCCLAATTSTLTAAVYSVTELSG